MLLVILGLADDSWAFQQEPDMPCDSLGFSLSCLWVDGSWGISTVWAGWSQKLQMQFSSFLSWLVQDWDKWVNLTDCGKGSCVCQAWLRVTRWSMDGRIYYKQVTGYSFHLQEGNSPQGSNQGVKITQDQQKKSSFFRCVLLWGTWP